MYTKKEAGLMKKPATSTIWKGKEWFAYVINKLQRWKCQRERIEDYKN